MSFLLSFLIALSHAGSVDMIHAPALKGPHGGVMKKSGEFELELKLEASSKKTLRVWILEGKERKPVASGTALRVKFRSRSPETHKRTERALECAPGEGKGLFECPLDFDPPRRAKLVISASLGERGGEAQFRWPLEKPSR